MPVNSKITLYHKAGDAYTRHPVDVWQEMACVKITDEVGEKSETGIKVLLQFYSGIEVQANDYIVRGDCDFELDDSNSAYFVLYYETFKIIRCELLRLPGGTPHHWEMEAV